MTRLIAAVAVLLLFAGCHAPSAATQARLARFFLESDQVNNADVVSLTQSGVRIAVGARPVLMEYDFVDVTVARVELGQCLLFQLTPAAAHDLIGLTASNQGRRLVLTIDGVAIGARRIDGVFADGRIFIFVEKPDSELPALAQELKRASVEARGRSRHS